MTLQIDLTVTRNGFTLDAQVDLTSTRAIAVLGANGAGKTTFLHALAGLLPLARGSVRVGDSIWEDRAAGIRLAPEERDVAVVFQDYRLFGHMSVIDNVAFGVRSSGATRSESRRRADVVLQVVGASHLAPRRPRDLSGGEAQLVAVARALARRPGVLLLDEPFAALDVDNRASARGAVADALRGFDGIKILVTHERADAEALTDRILVVDQGKIGGDGQNRPLT